MSRRPPSIATVVALALAATATLLLGTAGYVAYDLICRRAQNEFIREHRVLADTVATSLALPIWNFDDDQVGRVLDGAMQDQDVVAVAAHPVGIWPAQFGRLRAPDGTVKSTDQPISAGGLRREARVIHAAGQKVGDFQLFTTTRYLDERLHQAGVTIIALIGLADLVIVVGLYFLLHRIVLEPLQELERWALSLSSGDQTLAMPPLHKYGSELESLRGSMARMVTMIAQRYDALRESEQRLAQVFRAIPDAVVISDAETLVLLDCNEAFERVFRYRRADVLGKRPIDLGMWVHLEDRQRFFEALDRDGAVRDLPVSLRRRDGPIRRCILSAERTEVAGRRALIVASRDITDKLRAEAREREARDEFPRRLIASQEAERRRIAGELHDSLGQNLLLIKNRAQLALADQGLPANFRGALESIHDMSTQGIAEVRQISHDLRPYQLDQLGLTRALRAMVDGARASSGFPFECKIEDVDDLFSPESASNLYRIVQETLSNILKHARARSARVLLERDVSEVRLLIEDDGQGFPEINGDGEHRVSAGGLGLRSVAERARIIGATLRTDSAPGRGVRLELTIPFPEED